MDKKTKILPAFKVSTQLHETILRLAQLGNRKLHDEVRQCVELGAQVEEALLSRKEGAIKEITTTLGKRRESRDQK